MTVDPALPRPMTVRKLNLVRLEALREHLRAYRADPSLPNLLALLAMVRNGKSLSWGLVEQTVREELDAASRG